MKRIFVLLFFLVFVCQLIGQVETNTPSEETRILEETKLLMTQIFDHHIKVADSFMISEKLVDSLNYGSPVLGTWESIIKNREQYLPLVLEYKKIVSKDERTDFALIFAEVFSGPEAYDFITNSNSWKSLHPKYQYPNKGPGVVYYSYPVFSKDFSYALIYEARDYGAELVVFKKVDGRWNEVARGIVWVS
jgi:hypothetical protein